MATNWFNKTVDEVESTLKTNAENGLTAEEAKKRQEEYGLNELKAKKKKSLFVKFLEQFKDFMIIVLIIAAIISGVVGQLQGEGITDSIIILIVVIVNAIIGVAQENKAEKSLDALKKLSSYSAKVIRDGKLMVVSSKELVPGDIVELETGDYVPGQQDDDDFEKVVIKPFDLALRKFITKINGVELTGKDSRIPRVDLTPLISGTGTTAIYEHTKNPIIVNTGDKVT